MMTHGYDGMTDRYRALLLVILMVIAPLTALASGGAEPATAGPGTLVQDDRGPYPLSYGNREKDLTFFLHSVNASETSKNVAGHTTDWYMDTTLEFNGTSIITEVTSKTTFTWYLAPVLADNLTVTYLSFKMWIWATSTLGTPQGNLTVDIYEVNTTSWSFVTNCTTGDTSFLTTADLRVVSTDLSHTFQAGSSVVVNMTLDLTAGDSMTFAFDTARSNSRFHLRTTQGTSFNEVYTLDHNGLKNNTFDPVEQNKTMYMMANVTDEIGGYDIKWVNVTLERSGQLIMDNASMVKESGDNTSLYSEYQMEWNYSGYTNGRYNYTIWMTDNSGHNHFYHLQMYVWDNYTSEGDSFFTIGKMIYANVKVLDSMDVPMNGSQVSFQVSGPSTIMASGITNGSGMYNFTAMFSGSYDVLVMWQGVDVANVTVNLVDNITEDDPLIIQAAVFHPSIRIVDSKGQNLSDASVIMRYPNGTSSAEPFTTNVSGIFGLTQTANGTYGLYIKWMDVLVNDTNVDITSNDTIMVHTSVYYLATTVVDSRETPLPGTQIILANSSSGIVFDSKITNLSGGYEFRLPGGDYDIAVFWQNSLIYTEENYTLDDNTDLKLIGDIFYLIVKVVDTHGLPVETAQVLVIADEGNVLDSNFTDDSGRIDSRLPRGTHWVKVFWYGVLTNMTQVEFTDDSEVEVVAAIFYPNFTILDADGLPLSDARVDITINSTGETIESLITDDEGGISLRLPSTQYDVTVYWKGVQVHETFDMALTTDLETTLNVRVYSLEILCTDSRDEPLKEAHILMALTDDGREMASMLTDVNGTAIIRLPGASYDIEVRWENVLVANISSMVLDSSGQYIIHGAVFYLDGVAVDTRSVGLPGAIIDVFDGYGKALSTIMADTNGTFQLRLPVGNYTLEIQWKDQHVNITEDLAIGSDLSIEFQCSVYYLDVVPMDSKEIALEDALVALSSTSSGKVVGAGYTGAPGKEGVLTFRLPGDIYDIKVHWNGVLVNDTKGYILGHDHTLEMECSVYYLDVQVIDVDGIIISDAKVDLEVMNGSLNRSLRTDNTGSVTFRMPGAHYSIRVTWRDVQVYDEPARELKDDDTWFLEVAVHYPTFVLEDTRGEKVAGAHMDIYLYGGELLMESGDVSEVGALTARLPATEYLVRCSWLGHMVYDDTLVVSSSETVTLTVDVFYLEPSIFDSRDLALSDAVVDVADTGTSALMGTDITDLDGASVIRLPLGTYDLFVSWRGIDVYEQTGIEVNKDTPITIKAKVYYLFLTLKDDRQVAVEDALVEVSLEGDVFASGTSDANGALTLRLPVGTYDHKVTWNTVMVGGEEGLLLDKDLDRQVTLDIHYLTILVKDSEGQKLKGAMVSVLKDGETIFGAGQTDGNGRLEFRLPEGDYLVKVKYSSTHLMTDYSSTLKKEVALDGSLEETFTYSDYPPAIYTTNTFYMATLSLILIVLIIVAALKLLRPKRSD